MVTLANKHRAATRRGKAGHELDAWHGCTELGARYWGWTAKWREARSDPSQLDRGTSGNLQQPWSPLYPGASECRIAELRPNHFGRN